MLKFLSFLLCLTATFAVVPPYKLPLLAHRSLLQFMVNSKAATHENPERSLSCFDYYVPILNEHTAEYEKSYAACLKTADEAYENVDNGTQPQRLQVEDDAKEACNALVTCTFHESSIDYFNCFMNAGSNNSKTMYNISANSADILINVREQYRLVETEQFRCTNASERAYVENTASTYDEMQSCLQGKARAPTTTDTSTISTETTTGTPTIQAESTTGVPTLSTDSTTESTTESTTDTTTILTTAEPNSDFVNNQKSRSLEDSKWRRILSKLGSHSH